jgi:hypothetical protein
VDATARTIERLRSAGIRRMTVFSPVPSHELEHALHAGESPVRIFTLVGGLTGAATGFAMATWMSLDWPLVVGGKPIISLPAWVIIAFELTILFGALSTVAGMLISARLPQRRVLQVYDPASRRTGSACWSCRRPAARRRSATSCGKAARWTSASRSRR